MKTAITGLLPQEISEMFSQEPSYRGKQVFKWIYSNIHSFDDMKNIPAQMRSELNETFQIRTTKISKILRDPDGTVKLQIELHDGLCIETVLLIDSAGRKTACVSCQAGCAMNCAFCQTGHIGFGRSLSSAEIVEQFLYLEETEGKLDNIVFMGMGEPMLNLEAVRKTIAVLTHPEGRALSARRITLSTSGIIAGIYDLADNGPHIRLAVSLTTADPELRYKLMPVTASNPLPRLKEAIKYYIEKTGKRCTLEAALLGKVNTTDESFSFLKDFVSGLDVHVNIIPWNPVPGLPFTEPTAAECRQFMQKMANAGINVTMRTRRGQKIGGACGQLGKSSS